MNLRSVALLLALVAPGLALAAKPVAASPTYNPDDPSAIQVRDNIRVVFHASKDAWKKGLPTTLFYVERLVTTSYPQKLGVPASALDFKIVAHDAPVAWFLNDAAWKASKLKGQAVPQDHNPNKEVIARILAAGVAIEVCAVTMEQHGYTLDMLLPGVRVVPAGLPRVIDLQLMGYQHLAIE